MDGNWIAFSSDRDGNSELYVMRHDGAEVQRITHTPDDEYAPAWSPAIDLAWRAWINWGLGVIILAIQVRGLSPAQWRLLRRPFATPWESKPLP